MLGSVGEHPPDREGQQAPVLGRACVRGLAVGWVFANLSANEPAGFLMNRSSSSARLRPSRLSAGEGLAFSQQEPRSDVEGLRELGQHADGWVGRGAFDALEVREVNLGGGGELFLCQSQPFTPPADVGRDIGDDGFGAWARRHSPVAVRWRGVRIYGPKSSICKGVGEGGAWLFLAR